MTTSSSSVSRCSEMCRSITRCASSRLRRTAAVSRSWARSTARPTCWATAERIVSSSGKNSRRSLETSAITPQVRCSTGIGSASWVRWARSAAISRICSSEGGEASRWVTMICAGARGVAHVGALERAVAGAVEVAGIDAALAFQDELAGVVVQAIDHADVHPREAAHDLERLAGGGGQVGAAAHRREHRVQRFQLAVAPLERHAGAVRGRPRPCRRARPAGRRQERQHHPREHHRAGPQQGEELQQQAVLGPRELPHRQHHPEAAVGRRHDGLREPADREGLVAHLGGADRGRAGPAARGQVAPAGRERPVPRDEDHRRARGEPVQQRAQSLDAPAGHHGARAAGRLAPGRALHRRGDQEVRLAARQPQGQDRLGRGRRAGEARRRARRHLHQGRAARVTDRDEVGEPVARDGQHARGGAAGQDRPVALGRSLDHRGVAGKEDRLAPQRFLVVGDQGVHRVHGPGDRGVAGPHELAVGRDEPEPGQDPQRDRQQQERDEEDPDEPTHNLFSARSAANYTGFRSQSPR